MSKLRTAWRYRRTLLGIMFPRGRTTWRLVDLKVRWQVFRLLVRANRTRMYQPIPFSDFADVGARRDRACEERWRAMRSVLPRDISDLRFLDIGAAEGYFSFQCAKEGASVLALERDHHKVRLMSLLKQRYRLERFTVSEADMATSSLRPLGIFDYAFYLNVHQHIYKADPDAADRVLSELGQVCTRGIFLESRPVEFNPAVMAPDPSIPQPFSDVQGLLSVVKRGTGFTRSTEIFYEGYDAEADHRQSVPEGSASHYRLFYLTRPEAGAGESSHPATEKQES